MGPLQEVEVSKVANAMYETTCKVCPEVPQILTRLWYTDQVGDIGFILIHSIYNNGKTFCGCINCTLTICIVSLSFLSVYRENEEYIYIKSPNITTLWYINYEWNYNEVITLLVEMLHKTHGGGSAITKPSIYNTFLYRLHTLATLSDPITSPLAWSFRLGLRWIWRAHF